MMKQTKKGQRRWTRMLCLLLCLQFFLSMAPAERASADGETGSVTAYWTWDRLDTLIDRSAAALKQYQSILFIYVDYSKNTGSDYYVLGADGNVQISSMRMRGYYSDISGYSSYWDEDKGCYGSDRVPAGYNESVAVGTVFTADTELTYMEAVPRGEAFTQSNLSMLPYLESFETSDNVSICQLNSLKAGADFNTFTFEMSYDDVLIGCKNSYGDVLEVNDGAYTEWTLDFKAVPAYSNAMGSYSVFSTYDTAMVWRDLTLSGDTDAFWGVNGSHVFAEAVDAEKHNEVYDQMPRFFVFVGKPHKMSTLSEYTIRSGSVLEVNAGEPVFVKDELVVEPGAVLTVKGTLVNNGTIKNYGTIYVRDGGTISRSVNSSGGEDVASIQCLGTVRGADLDTYSSVKSGSPAEGCLIIEENGRVMIGEKGSLVMESGCLLECDGELILPRPIVSSGGGESLHFRENSVLIMGAALRLTSGTVAEQIMLVSDRGSFRASASSIWTDGPIMVNGLQSSITMEEYYNMHASPKLVSDGTGFYDRLVFVSDFSAYTTSGSLPGVRQGRILIQAGWWDLLDGKQYNEREYPTEPVTSPDRNPFLTSYEEKQVDSVFRSVMKKAGYTGYTMTKLVDTYKGKGAYTTYTYTVECVDEEMNRYQAKLYKSEESFFDRKLISMEAIH